MDIRVSGDRASHIDTDRRGIDQFDMTDSLCLNRFDMCRHRTAVAKTVQCRHKAFQNQGCLAAAGHTGDHTQSVFRNLHAQRFHRMNCVCFHTDPFRIVIFFLFFGNGMLIGKIRTDQ